MWPRLPGERTNPLPRIAQIPTCHPSHADFIYTVPELSAWIATLASTPHGGAVYTKDCPGDMPYGFTFFMPTSETLSRVLAGMTHAILPPLLPLPPPAL